MGRLKTMIRNWLELMPAQNNTLVIQEPLSFEGNALKNRILYRGDPSELEQLFKQMATDEVSSARFWAATPTKGQRIRKIHSGLPGMIVNILADIVVTDMLEVEFKDLRAASNSLSIWKAIAKENNMKRLVSDAIQEVLVVGDGAFKISFDTDLSQYPILEFFGGEKVEYKYCRGRIHEVLFKTHYHKDKSRSYQLTEIYGKGYVRYLLTDVSGNEVPLSTLEDTASLVDISYEGNDILAIPFQIYQSPKWDGRGRSILDLKLDAFDALDETISQWQDALRQGRIKRYIPETIIPRDPETGRTLSPNPFDNQFIALRASNTEGAEQKIQTDQPQLDYAGFINTYLNNLDLCLQGVISPSTLGIDTKKLDNAEAQREKEKTTLYTRNKIITVLQEVLPELVRVSLNAHSHLIKRPIFTSECTVEFGEYANPSFEAQVETLGKAATTQIMSVESQVKTLWGDSKDDKWIDAEIKRIRSERGFAEVDEPTFVPNGFSEEDGLVGVDQFGSGSTGRHGAIPVSKHGSQSSASPRGRKARETSLDTVASTSASEHTEV